MSVFYEISFPVSLITIQRFKINQTNLVKKLFLNLILKKKTNTEDKPKKDLEKNKEAEEEEDDDDEEEEPNSTLFVKNLNFDTEEASLKKVKFVKIRNCFFVLSF